MVSTRINLLRQNMANFQLIYMSSLVNADPAAATEILEVSVRNNKRNDITGMMLYAEGNIVQVLEGEYSRVTDTFNRIIVDPRHVGVFVLYEREIEERDFGYWSMGYKQLEKADIEGSGFAADVFEIREQEVTRRVRPSDALLVCKCAINPS
jgi:hypothetical protein